MKVFFQKFFQKEITVDQEKINDQARFSLENSQFDKELFLAVAKSLHIKEDFQAYMISLLQIAKQDKIDLSTEINNLKTYLKFFEASSTSSFFYKIELKGFDNARGDIAIAPFILFPILKNALYGGYNTIERYPVRIRIQLMGDILKLEVSNRVNHHISNQEMTTEIRWFKARLEQLYPDKYTLLFNSNTSIFKANLLVNLV